MRRIAPMRRYCRSAHAPDAAVLSCALVAHQVNPAFGVDEELFESLHKPPGREIAGTVPVMILRVPTTSLRNIVGQTNLLPVDVSVLGFLGHLDDGDADGRRSPCRVGGHRSLSWCPFPGFSRSSTWCLSASIIVRAFVLLVGSGQIHFHRDSLRGCFELVATEMFWGAGSRMKCNDRQESM